MNGQIGQPIYKTYKSLLKNDQTQIEKQKCPTVFASPSIFDLPSNNTTATAAAADDTGYSIDTVVRVQEGMLLGAGLINMANWQTMIFPMILTDFM